MNQIKFRYLLVLCFIALTWNSACLAFQRVAIVIGNSNYSTVPLPNPENDSKAMAQKLTSMGFKVKLFNDLSQAKMYDAMDSFFAEQKDVDDFLFFYAGHAVQVNGKNYIIPIDVDFNSDDFLSRLFDIRYLIDKMSLLNPKGVKIVILDACRDNPFSSHPQASSGLAEISAPGGTFIAFSTAPGKTAEDGDDANSPYMTSLLKSISVPGKKIEEIFKDVRTKVKVATNGRQIPWEATSLESEFYFTPQPQPVKTDKKSKASKVHLSKKQAADVDKRCNKIFMKLSLGMEALNNEEQELLQSACR